MFTGLTKVRKNVDHVDRKFYVVKATIDGVEVDLKGQRLVAASDGSIFGKIKYEKSGQAAEETIIGKLDVETNSLTPVS